MGGFSIKSEGFKELDAKLAQIGDMQANGIVRDALRAAGDVTAAAIRERAPVRPSLPSGTALPEGALSRDIEVFVGEEDGYPSAIVRPGSETAYAAEWVEYGHRLVTGGYNKLLPSGTHRGGGRVIGDVPAHPFIRPGFEVSAAAAIEALRATVAREVEEAAARK